MPGDFNAFRRAQAWTIIQVSTHHLDGHPRYRRITWMLDTGISGSSCAPRPAAGGAIADTNPPSVPPAQGVHDINEPFLRVGEPVARVVRDRGLPVRMLDIGGLESITTEVLVVAGALDQVTPVEEQMKVRRWLPNARFVLFNAYHCLEDQREVRRELLEAFLRNGSRSPEVERILDRARRSGVFLRGD